MSWMLSTLCMNTAANIKKIGAIGMETHIDVKQFMDQLVEDLVNDPNWDLPAEDRKYLRMNLIWNLVFL